MVDYIVCPRCAVGRHGLCLGLTICACYYQHRVSNPPPVGVSSYPVPITIGITFVDLPLIKRLFAADQEEENAI